jgi:hypothetical protein
LIKVPALIGSRSLYEKADVCAAIFFRTNFVTNINEGMLSSLVETI